MGTRIIKSRYGDALIVPSGIKAVDYITVTKEDNGHSGTIEITLLYTIAEALTLEDEDIIFECLTYGFIETMHIRMGWKNNVGMKLEFYP